MVHTAYIVMLSQHVPIMAYSGIHWHTIVDKSSYIYSIAKICKDSSFLSHSAAQGLRAFYFFFTKKK